MVDWRKQRLIVTLLNVLAVASALSFHHKTISAQSVGRHPYQDKKCPTCEEHPRLQPLCPDCRDRGTDMYGRPVQTKRLANSSGNLLWEALQQEKKSIKEEAYDLMMKEAMEEDRKKHSRMCPVCDTVGYVPDNDYMCESCRSGL